MDKITGKIQKVSKDDGLDKNGNPYTRWIFLINDKKYSTFDEKIGEKFEVGQEIVMEGEARGQYWNMKSMKLADQSEQKESAPQPSNNETTDLLRQIIAEIKELGTRI